MSDRDKIKGSIGKVHTYEACFDQNSPRPPVPGEERSHCMSDWGHLQMDWSKQKSSSPTPRKYHTNESTFAPCGYEPEGSCRNSNPPSGHGTTRLPRSDSRISCDNLTPPACLRWAQSLHSLLQDSDGVKLFLQYLESEGQLHADALHFWFACEGLRKQIEKEKIQQLVKVIFKKFLVKSALPINEDLRRDIANNIKFSHCLDPPVTLFDEAQAQLEHLINNTTYPNFLKSEIYLQYLQSVQNPSTGSGELSSGSSSSSSTKDLAHLASGVGTLETIHEDMEFVSYPPVHLIHTPGTNMSTGCHTPNMGQPVRLTKDMLLMSQEHRAAEVRPKSETYAGLFMFRNVGAHAAYNSYNPVSRQASEMQSLSSHSDARTESDNLSLTDSSVDGKSLGKSLKRRAALEAKQVKESAAVNRETHMHQTLIPRTQRMDTRQCKPMHPDQFAAILIEKLEILKREQDTQELLDRKLKESDSMSSLDDKLRMSDVQSRALANAIKEKLLLEDDNDQDILDQHVSRVFSDLTPSRSPGFISPRPHSPHRNRYAQNAHSRTKRRDKDGFSTFSGDSGNVHDFADGSEHRMAMVKSKSMPEYADERFIRGGAGRRSSSKKTLTDLTDSGVSVVSDTPPVMVPVPTKDNRVLAWLLDSDKSGKSTSQPHSEMSMKHRSHRTSSATSPIATRHRKGYGSRSNSLERTSVSGNLGPAQPFVADPSMPPPPLPNTTIQLEEARRRLMDDEFRTKPRLRSANKYYPDITQSSQSTLRKSTRGVRPSLPATSVPEEFTTVVFSYSDEQFPYRTKIPGSQITLRQFKEYLPKKGNYRFFFKTVCEELGNQVIQEEVNRDTDILPLWEGKIMAQAKPVD